MPKLASHIDLVPASGIRRIHEAALGLNGVTMLAVGEPDVPVAPHIAAAAKAAWDADKTDYTPNGGILPFREAVVAKLAAVNGIAATTDQVWSTIGATQAISQALGLVLDVGDEVLVPNPGYTTFSMSTRMLQAVPSYYSLLPENGFLPDLAELDSLVTSRTRAIIVNSPSNPIGVVFPESVLRDIMAFAERHDLWVISDEVYEAFTHGTPHVSIGSLDDGARVLSAFSLSKTYAMTGIRIGYLVTPPGLVDVMRRVQEGVISCVNEPAQYAAIAAITGDQFHVEQAAAHYRRNIARATAILDERGIRYLAPQGAFYLWVDVSHVSGGDVQAWAERFLSETRVAVAPGSAFGTAGEGWIRLCAAASPDDLLLGVNALPAP
ncbi:aminotransferase class I/II-fold pyridoxal phosphate-dependent enzyme [Gryllotalpicola sp.]|uniref:pyridoxal phosphate-dependent aminotransferase n=1 Tax=Gryllotalpicola sp. TaxID=1932787 RepID=UPI002605BAB6|nr:aminotransferase class I/II-fold pyridoxal phosphate-dependent enzyme [Gryllotalpicola sp.]